MSGQHSPVLCKEIRRFWMLSRQRPGPFPSVGDTGGAERQEHYAGSNSRFLILPGPAESLMATTLNPWKPFSNA